MQPPSTIEDKHPFLFANALNSVCNCDLLMHNNYGQHRETQYAIYQHFALCTELMVYYTNSNRQGKLIRATHTKRQCKLKQLMVALLHFASNEHVKYNNHWMCAYKLNYHTFINHTMNIAVIQNNFSFLRVFACSLDHFRDWMVLGWSICNKFNSFWSSYIQTCTRTNSAS